MEFSKEIHGIDCAKEITTISGFIKEVTAKGYNRKGAVIGLSGGIDSAVVGELCVRALGKERVLALFLPEKESNPLSLEYGQKQAEKMGVKSVTVDITKYLESLGVYEMRNSVIRGIFPEFNDSIRFHVTLPQNLLDRDRLNYHSITIEDTLGQRRSKRISAAEWLKISACQNMKQRMRMIQLYYQAEKHNYIVAGTTNKSEVMGGFFVKYGDGGVDIEPIAHLYKVQVFALAREIGVVKEIINRPPSPDTYSLPVTDKEFYFCMDYELLDPLLYAFEHQVTAESAGRALGLQTEQVERVFRDIARKEQTTWHLRQMPPCLEQNSIGQKG